MAVLISLREVVVEGIVVLLSGFVTFIFCFRVWKVILRHQNRVRANQHTQNFGHLSIDLAKYKKSAITIFYILGIFTVCYLPPSLFLIVMAFGNNFQSTFGAVIASKILLTLYLIPSSLNPLICCWRIRDLHVEVKQLLIQFICGY